MRRARAGPAPGVCRVRAGTLGCGGLSLVRAGSAAASRRRPRGGPGLRRWRVAGWRVRAAGGGLDLGPVAAAVSLLDHLAGCGQVGDDAVVAAPGDVQAGPAVAPPPPP